MKKYTYDSTKDKLLAKVLKQAFKSLLDDCHVRFSYGNKEIVLSSYNFSSMDEITLNFTNISLTDKLTGKKVVSKCLNCKNDFVPKSKSMIFCSAECRKKFNSRKKTIDELEDREKRIFKRKFIDKKGLNKMDVNDLLDEFGNIE